jgi:hypothetical protein
MYGVDYKSLTTLLLAAGSSKPLTLNPKILNRQL